MAPGGGLVSFVDLRWCPSLGRNGEVVGGEMAGRLKAPSIKKHRDFRICADTYHIQYHALIGFALVYYFSTYSLIIN